MADIATLGIKVDSQGVVKATNDLGKLSQQGARVEKQTVSTTSSLGGMGRSAGQAGIQIQQLVGQIQGGVSPMVALSQQATDLGFVLGFPLLGAVVGIAAALAGTLLPALFDSRDAMEELESVADDLDMSLRELSPAAAAKKIREFKESIDSAKESIAEKEVQIRNLNNTMQRFIKLGFDAQANRIKSQIEEVTIEIDEQNAKIKQAQKNIAELNGTTTDHNKTLERFIQRTQEQAETLGMTNTQLLVYRARQLGANQADIERIQSLGMEIEAYEARLEKEKEIADWKKQNERDLKKANEERLKAQEKAFDATLKQLRPIEDGFVNLINGTKGVAGAFRDMAQSVVNDLIRIHIQSTITKPLAGLIGGAGGFSGILSSFMGGGTGGATSYGVSNYMPPSFDGGGYTGMAPRSGGIDGKGGFPAILHPNETVVDHSKGGGMGETVIVQQTINVTTGIQQTVRNEIANMMPQIVNAAKQGVLDARKRGGSFSSTFGAS